VKFQVQEPTEQHHCQSLARCSHHAEGLLVLLLTREKWVGLLAALWVCTPTKTKNHTKNKIKQTKKKLIKFFFGISSQLVFSRYYKHLTYSTLPFSFWYLNIFQETLQVKFWHHNHS
jgi:hypothetical protein